MREEHEIDTLFTLLYCVIRDNGFYVVTLFTVSCLNGQFDLLLRLLL